MLRDGQYAAWFRTPRGEGTGLLHLANGRISGGDSFFSYSGVYEIDGDRFTATLTTMRVADGPSTTVFGLDEIELKLTGTFKGPMARCSGTSDQAPGVPFEATLFLSQDQAPQPDALQRPLPDFKVGKLPRAAGGRYRPRNPFGSGPSR